MRKRKEGDVLRGIMEYLQVLENRGIVVKYMRLQSGSLPAAYINKAGALRRYRVKLCPTGTPDILAVLNNGFNVWIEGKRDENSQQRTAQEAFEATIIKLPGHYYVLAESTDNVVRLLFDIKAIKTIS